MRTILSLRKNVYRTLLLSFVCLLLYSAGANAQVNLIGCENLEKTLVNGENDMGVVYLSNTGQDSADVEMILSNPSPMNESLTMKFSPSLMTISPGDGLQNVSVSADVVDDAQPKVFLNRKIAVIENGTELDSCSFAMTIDDVERWEIVKNNVSRNTKAMTGDVTDAGVIMFRNTGNIDFDIELDVTGNGKKFINVPSSRTLYRDSTYGYPIQIQVPSNQQRGRYPVVLNFKAGSSEYVYEMNITVRDNILPEIESIEFEHERAMMENTITVVAKDNLEVSNVSISYDDKEYFFEKDQQFFTYTTTFERLSRYLFRLCAYDVDENSRCVDFNKTFEKLDIISLYDDDIVFPSVKFNTFTRAPIFNLSMESDDVIVRLEEFSFGGNISIEDADIRLIDGNKKVKKFSKYVKEIKVEKPGIIYLEIKSPKKTTFDGRLEFIVPDHIEQPGDIFFDGDFKTYDVPQSFEREWFNDEKLKCEVIDTGDLDSTYYDCNVKLRASIDEDNLPIPITPEERRKMEAEYNTSITQMRQEKTAYQVVVGLLLGVLVLVTGIGVFMFNYGPYLRIAFNRSDKDK